MWIVRYNNVVPGKKSLKNLEKSLLARIGPGVITGAADDDPSGIATYSTAGAQLGFQILWMPLFTLPLMSSIQEMCARIGIVTQHGLAGTIRRFYPKSLLYAVAGLVFIANSVNIGADIAAVSASVQLLAPQIPQIVTGLVFVGFLTLLMVVLSYHTLSKIFKWLTLSLLLYVFSALAANPPWQTIVINTIVPTIHFDKSFFLVIVAVLGTTISPYLFFWQASTEAEEKVIRHSRSWFRRLFTSKEELKLAQEDVFVGMTFSNLIMYFIIAAAAATLYTHGVTAISTAADAARALEPIAGRASALFFTFGIIGTGALAIPVLAGSAAYAVAEAAGWKSGLNQKFHEARGFYLILAFSTLVGLVLTWLRLDPIKLLFYTAVMYGVISPPLIAIILKITNDKRVMGHFVNSWTQNLWGVAALVVMSLSALALVFF